MEAGPHMSQKPVDKAYQMRSRPSGSDTGRAVKTGNSWGYLSSSVFYGQTFQHSVTRFSSWIAEQVIESIRD
jgi:hypothetical protein